MKTKKMNEFVRVMTGGNAIGISLAPFGIYIKEGYLRYKYIINHESIHWAQQMEMLIVFFYIWYLIEWLLKTIIHGKAGYYYISFEREAFTYDDDLEYLKTRKHFAWIKFLRYKKK